MTKISSDIQLTCRLHLPSSPDPVVTSFLGGSFVPTDLPKCDFIFYPSYLNNEEDIPRRLQQISDTFKESGKTVLVLLINDYEYHYNYFNNLFLFRTSLRASRQRRNEVPIPYNFESLPKAFHVLKTNDAPKVGFCGLVTKDRKKMIEAFEKEEGIQTNFIKRDQFWGGKPHDPLLVKEFNTNIQENHFTIAPRGKGNFSMRFYQTLAAGRIPVMVDTDMRLPFERDIDWKEIAIIGKGVSDCVKKVKTVFHSGRHIDMQKNASDLYFKYLSSNSYFRHWSFVFGEKEEIKVKEERWSPFFRFFDVLKRRTK